MWICGFSGTFLITFAIFVTETINSFFFCFVKCIYAIHTMLARPCFTWNALYSYTLDQQSPIDSVKFTQRAREKKNNIIRNSQMHFWRFIFNAFWISIGCSIASIEAVSQCNQCIYSKINWYSVHCTLWCLSKCAAKTLQISISIWISTSQSLCFKSSNICSR